MLKLTALVLLLTISSYFCEHVEITPTIVGGRNATLGQFPYMVSLQGKATPGRSVLGLETKFLFPRQMVEEV